VRARIAANWRSPPPQLSKHALGGCWSMQISAERGGGSPVWDPSETDQLDAADVNGSLACSVWRCRRVCATFALWANAMWDWNDKAQANTRPQAAFSSRRQAMTHAWFRSVGESHGRCAFLPRFLLFVWVSEREALESDQTADSKQC